MHQLNPGRGRGRGVGNKQHQRSKVLSVAVFGSHREFDLLLASKMSVIVWRVGKLR